MFRTLRPAVRINGEQQNCLGIMDREAFDLKSKTFLIFGYAPNLL
jgi:hypothetical protein